MSRVIKLRVPILNNGKFDHFNFHEISVSDKQYNFGNCHFLGDYEIKDPQLFTGLHDKNGKEIYEGDIIKWSNGIMKGNSEVAFYDGSFRIKGYPFDEHNMLETGERVEVIGNIYENTELIK